MDKYLNDEVLTCAMPDLSMIIFFQAFFVNLFLIPIKKGKMLYLIRRFRSPNLLHKQDKDDEQRMKSVWQHALFLL
jgi:hypothetical protein